MSDIVSLANVYAAAFARTCAFAATVPLAGFGSVPRIVRAALAIALTPVVAFHATSARGTETGVLEACAANAVVGAAFGIAASIVASAASAAGGVTDAALALPVTGREAMSGGGDGSIARVYSLLFAGALFASGGFTHLCAAFVHASWLPELPWSSRGAIALMRTSVAAALTLAMPAIGGQLVGALIAAVGARVAPRINGMMLASPVTTAVVLLSLVAAAPVTVRRLVDLAYIAAAGGAR